MMRRGSSFGWRSTAICVVCAAGCGGGGGSPRSVGDRLQANIGGQGWVADASTIDVRTSSDSASTLVISGSNVGSLPEYDALTIAIGFVNGPRTYALGVNESTNAGGPAGVTRYLGGTTTSWSATYPGPGNTFTISSMSASRFAGTFQFTGVNVPPEDSSNSALSDLVVTGGEFDLPLPSAFAPPAANDYGSSMSATVDGQPWEAWQVIPVGVPTSNVDGSGSTLNLGLDLGLLVVGAEGIDGSWGGGSGDANSVVITASGNSRVAGTFTATLQPAGGSSLAPLTITAGKFDVLVTAGP